MNIAHATSLSQEVLNVANDISRTRDKIKDDFCKAYLASKFPCTEEEFCYIMKNIELVEEWKNGEKTQVTWYFRERK